MAKDLHNSPKLQDFLIIGDNPHLIAQLSCVLARAGYYSPVLDGPRLERPDAKAEVIRRSNIAALFQPKTVIFADMPSEVQNSFQGHLPQKMIQCVDTIDEFKKTKVNSKTFHNETLRWGPKNIGIGLLLALKEKKEITFTDDNTDISSAFPESEHIVVCEEGDEFAQVIAANYAFSMNAGLMIIPEISKEDSEEICETFYSSSEPKHLNQTECLEALKDRLRKMSKNIPVKGRQLITFVTPSTPWGFAYPEIPTTHIFSYPDIGISILNSIIFEKIGAKDMSLGLMIDPQQTMGSEVEQVKENLFKRGMVVKSLIGPGANVYNVTKNINFSPYDFLLISTHCGDTGGWRWTYEFIDSEGVDRQLVVDVAVGIGNIPTEDEMLEVMQFNKFISLDGVDWNDSKAKEELHIGTAISDYIERSKNYDEFKPTKREEVKRVMGSAALKMWDHNFLFVPDRMAGSNFPIILNNACCSWHRLASSFIFGNARAYIGTLFAVLDAQACEIAIKLTDKYFNRPLSVALWRAQNDVYKDSIKRPYIMVGPHFQKFHIKNNDKIKIISDKLMAAFEMHTRALKADKTEYGKKISKEVLEFLGKEIESLTKIRTKK